MSPDAVSAAISAVRQQMCNMVAAAQHHPDANAMLGGFNLPGHLSIHPHSGGAGSGIPIPKLGSPANMNSINNNGGATGVPAPRHGSPAHGLNLHATLSMPVGNNPPNAHPQSTSGSNNLSHSPGTSIATLASGNSQQLSHSITNLSSSNSKNNNNNNHKSSGSSSLSITRISSPTAHDLRMSSPADDSPSATPVSMVLEPAVNLAIASVSSLSSDSQSIMRKDFSSSPLSRLNYDRSPSRSSTGSSFKETTIKIEPMTDCRSD